MIKAVKTIIGCGVVSFALLSFSFNVFAFNTTSDAFMKESNKLIEKYMPIAGCSLTEVVLPKECDINFQKECDINYEKPQPKIKQAIKTNKIVDSNSKKIVDKIKTRPAISRGGTILSPKKYNSISMSSEERYWLEKLIEAESADEPYIGKVAVATTIANRIKNDEFPNTVMEVIKQTLPQSNYHQYSPWDDGSIYERTPSIESRKAVTQVFDDGIRNLPDDAVYFYAPEYSPKNWIQETRKQITTIGGHIFCSTYEK